MSESTIFTGGTIHAMTGADAVEAIRVDGKAITAAG